MLYFLLGILAAVAIAFVVVVWKISREHRDHNAEDVKPEKCEVTVVVVIGAQGRLLLIDENNRRITRYPLFPGMRAVAVGVGKIMPDGALAISTRDVEDSDDDFDEVGGTYLN